ncbi:exodeoxyribonuclease VII small subunit [Ktedonosporobacter rubrisoli]|uniref:Exodeoxyribonuclease 7 small subunit n=1 Tax=Ktedonosporobacter rubrisoli TaxID=2509675 RepID=A0A4P6JSZ3_KTERU|nr:exodeoxyribonuclease VII small subunit [Ktedonosporobacter rubrisoli]QBD78403.1 exodeoxyribonuclease VII small subunit [Ktedonosporobacter rubrisoli]
MEELSFEDAFAQLEEAVAALQDGHISLDQALQHYQKGVSLAQYCNELLQKAELTVQQLGIDRDGTLSLQPLDL